MRSLRYGAENETKFGHIGILRGLSFKLLENFILKLHLMEYII